MPVNHRFLALALALCPLTWLRGDQLFPSADGTTWNYEMTQDSPSTDIDLDQNRSDQTKSDESRSKEHFTLSYRITGTQKIDNLEFVKLEMYRGDVRTS